MKHAMRAPEIDPVCDIVRRNSPETVERKARELFEANDEEDRDRYDRFDDQPEGLQEWWRDRAARQIVSAPYAPYPQEAAPHEQA